VPLADRLPARAPLQCPPLGQVRDVDPATLAVLRDRARSLGQSLSGYLRDLMDADAAAETNAEVIARIARDREPVDLTMDVILAARDEGRC
jgi:hypothetical protein